MVPYGGEMYASIYALFYDISTLIDVDLILLTELFKYP